MTKGILFYTNNALNMKLAKAVREQLKKANLPITSVSLKPIDFGNNIHFPGHSGYETMFQQILTGLEAMKEDIVFFAEHDVFYHPSHFDFTPENDRTFYYNDHYWFVRLPDGFAVNYNVSPLSGLCAYREPLIVHFKERVEKLKHERFSYYMGFEPMTHGRIKWNTMYDFKLYHSEYPDVDVCHGGNLTRKRWSQEKFKTKPKYWNEGTTPDWAKHLVEPFLEKPKAKDRSLSILIPARNEEWLKETIDDIFKNSENEQTEVIAVLDGDWPVKPIPDNERLTLVKLGKSIGQRAATNLAARISKSKYVMKLDAHCSFDKGFDRKMIEAFKETGDNVVMTPAMKNLHVFDWVCDFCKARDYQGAEHQCKECGGKMKKEVKWFAKPSPLSTSYRFNDQLEFKYFGEYKAKQIGEIVDTMSLQGSCFMATRENYWEKELCDETWGSWGGQGAEVAIKAWLSGMEVKVNKKTWYAHLFRTQPGFSHPYPNPCNEQKNAKNKLRDTFLNNKWPKQVHELEWLVEKFSPVPDWPTNEK